MAVCSQILDEFSMLNVDTVQAMLHRLLSVHAQGAEPVDRALDVFEDVLSRKALVLVGDAQQLPPVCSCRCVCNRSACPLFVPRPTSGKTPKTTSP
jgi:hypothetical protein